MSSAPNNKQYYSMQIKYEPCTSAGIQLTQNEESHEPKSLLPNASVYSNQFNEQWTGMNSASSNQDDNAIDMKYEQSTCEENKCTSDCNDHHPESLLSHTPLSNEQYFHEQRDTVRSNKQNHVIQIKCETNTIEKMQASKYKQRHQLEKFLLPKTCKENTDASSSSQSKNSKVSTCLRKYLDGIEKEKRRLRLPTTSQSSLLKCGYVSYYSVDEDPQSNEQTAPSLLEREQRKDECDKTKQDTHEIQHTGEKIYKCDKCSYSGKRKAHLKVHYKMHTAGKLYSCDLCSFVSVKASAVTVHKRAHTNEKTHKCKFCAFGSWYYKTVANHIRNMHNGGEPYKCELCSYSTLHLWEFKKHIKQHKDKKPYKCDVCHYIATCPAILERHRVKHTGEKPYTCN